MSRTYDRLLSGEAAIRRNGSSYLMSRLEPSLHAGSLAAPVETQASPGRRPKSIERERD
jgi:hypothetical protein